MNWEWVLAAKCIRSGQGKLTTTLPFNDLMREKKCLHSYLSRQILKTKLAGGGTVLLSEVRRSPKLTLDKPKILQSALMDFVASQCEGVAVCVSCRCWHTHPVLGVLFLPKLVLPGGCYLWNHPGGFSTLKSKTALPRAQDVTHSWDFRLWELIPREIWQTYKYHRHL